MPENISLKKRRHPVRDLSVILVVFAVSFAISIEGNFFEKIVALDNAFPRWHIDDFIVAITASFVALGWYAWRRWRESRHQAASLLKIIETVEARNRTIEQTARDLAVARDAAEAASRAKSEFLNNMSHELRTPLNAIIGFTELIAQGVGQTGWLSCYMEYLSDVTDSGKHLLDLINTVLDLAKIQSGQLEMHLEPVNPCDLVKSSVALVSGMARDGGIAISTKIPPDCPDIQVDRLRLKQVLLNVLSNAIKFTGSGGTIHVDVSFARGRAVIAVRDSGCGISENDLERIMLPFVQVDPATSRKFGGSGLGLAIARELCNLQGGTLKLTSTVGRGTTVRLSFPQTAEVPTAKLPIAA
jgi:two-component system cell cycle sensor histidine kinase PleC